MWRKRRVCQFEAAAHRRGLNRAFDVRGKIREAALVHLRTEPATEDELDALQSDERDTQRELKELAAYAVLVKNALHQIDRDDSSYRFVHADLSQPLREWWSNFKSEGKFHDGKAVYADLHSLRRFLVETVQPYLQQRRNDLEDRPLIREQAFGESLDLETLPTLVRYERI